MPAIKFSRQRASILEYLRKTDIHPTADTIYTNVRKSFPNISLGTVYRNLNLLVKQGLIVNVNCGDDSERFDGDISPHYHFICMECHTVLDLKMDSIEHINILAASNFDGEIEGHRSYFYGRCGKCKKNFKKSIDI